MTQTFYSVILLIGLLSCQQANTIKISAEKLKELQKEGVLVVDIRTEKEYNEGHIPDVSENIDYLKDDFLSKMEGFDKTKPVIIHCARGGRSGKASSLLQQAGFIKIYDYVGGFNDWKARGEAIEK